MRKQRIILKHHTEIALLGWLTNDGTPIDADVPAVGRGEAGEGIEDRGFARATGTENGQKFTRLDGE